MFDQHSGYAMDATELLQVTGDHSTLTYFFSYTFPISLTVVISFLCHLLSSEVVESLYLVV